MALTLPTTVRGFHDYFKLTASPRDLAEAFGYAFEVEAMSLPQATDSLSWLSALEGRLSYALRHFIFDSETARRECLIGPVLFEVARYLEISLRFEYGIQATPQLKGTLDYLFQSQQSLLVIEAKQADLTRGFSQLTAELIALDHLAEIPNPILFGAVSYGDMWRFGRLDRQEKRIVQDVSGVLVPDSTEKLVRTLIAILRGEVAT